jgi:HEAT repeat protein
MGASTELADLYASESSTEVKQQIIQGLLVGRAPDRLADLARKEKDETLRRAAIRNLGVMNQGRTGDVLRGLYANESSVEVKKEIVNALFIQRNAAALVELARNEKDAALRREIVSKLSLMRDKAATDYLLELLQ